MGDLVRVDTVDALHQPLREYYLEGAEDLGPVVIETADGRAFLNRPRLVDDETSPEQMAETAAELLEEAPDDAPRLSGFFHESYDPQTETVEAWVDYSDGTRKRERVPLYVLPRFDTVADVYDHRVNRDGGVVTTGIYENIPHGQIVGDSNNKDFRHAEAMRRFGYDSSYRAADDIQRDMMPHAASESSTNIWPNVYGRVFEVPGSQNQAERRYYGSFLTRSKIRNRPGEPYYYLQIDPENEKTQFLLRALRRKKGRPNR